ncbi:ATP-binding protein [Butyricicoccus sp. AF10-3]|nr:ATP-binding protein [Butyricicoccus sp. AF10-3]
MLACRYYFKNRRFCFPSACPVPAGFSVILGNTLDNAIRACNGVSADTPKIVSLTLRQKDSILYYRISNPYDPEFSSKKREGIHGYGLKNVSSTVEQIGGTMQINQENNQYTVEIILNL